MNQCVPSWGIDDPPNPSSLLIHQYLSAAAHVSMPENEVAELTWENGHLSVHGLTHPRISKPTPKYPSPSPASAWDKLRPSGTLESVVDQATQAQLIPNSPVLHPDLAAWLSAQHHHVPPNPSAVDAVVPCSSHPHSKPRPDPVADPASGIVASSGGGSVRKRARVLEASQVSAGPTGGGRGESTRVTLDTCDDVGFTTASASLSLLDGEGGGSPDTENASFGGGRPPTVDEHDSVGHSRRFQRDRARDDEEKASKEETGRSVVFAKRSRAAIHNQSERKRRDRINQRMRTLQKLVPNSSKTDKASMLDEVIEYVKQLQAQVQMMARMGSIPPMMMPMSMQQLQMSMMAQMAHMAQMAQMGIGLGMVDLNALNRAGNAGIASVLHPSGMPPVFSPAAFLPVTGTPGDVQPSSGTMFPDPFSPMLACPPQQPMGMDVYNRMVALYKQLNQHNAGTNPNG